MNILSILWPILSISFEAGFLWLIFCLGIAAVFFWIVWLWYES